MNEYDVLTTLCVYLNGKASVDFNRNCFFENERLFKVMPPTSSHVHRESGSFKEVVQDRLVVITHH